MTIKDKFAQKKTSYAVTNIRINENYLSINFQVIAIKLKTES